MINLKEQYKKGNNSAFFRNSKYISHNHTRNDVPKCEISRLNSVPRNEKTKKQTYKNNKDTDEHK